MRIKETLLPDSSFSCKCCESRVPDDLVRVRLASQGHEMHCHDLEVMGLNSSLVECGAWDILPFKSHLIQIYEMEKIVFAIKDWCNV